MTIGQLEDELCLVGADSIQYYGRNGRVKAVTLGHASKDREFQSEQVTVGRMLAAVPVDDHHICLWKAMSYFLYDKNDKILKEIRISYKPHCHRSAAAEQSNYSNEPPADHGGQAFWKRHVRFWTNHTFVMVHKLAKISIVVVHN